MITIFDIEFEGIPVIKQDQERVASTSVQFITAGTFFSSVTASTLQVSYAMDGGLANSVNAFWFSSLALSVASVVYGLFHYIWNQSRKMSFIYKDICYSEAFL